MSEVLGVLAVALFGGTVLTVLGVILGKSAEDGRPQAPQGCDHGKDAGDDPAMCDCRKV